MDGAVFLPCLKILHLIHLRHLGGGETHAPLLPGCPVLEELVIGFIADQRCNSCTISSSTIKRLTIHFQFVTSIASNEYWPPEFEDDLFFGMFRRRVYNHGYKVDVNTPALRYLYFDDRLSEHIVSGELASLIEADIYLRNDNKKGDDVLYPRFVLEFFDRLCNVKRLKLDLSYCTEIVDSVFSSWNISFGNLTKLELTADCRFLSKFLEYADNLGILIFWEVGEQIKEWREPEQVPTCLLSNL
ncbi:PREDICTED: putative F-box protein At1g58310 [Erythranthe guttata]|uniref:putative F-box protein At1g58310 n=1 Tax=Erythranthe guttata TaxID=4155 RepID=UPI00064D7D42|nr:PREDICTED: putative F-box protein At1g58310 [Erythranthe guttata]|eukprot:XP_012848345.1 PREDICTED: putative F-box protein At1g58310 [Erythranthe guttata]